MIIVRDRVRK